MTHVLTTCTFCGAGCGLYLETAAGRVVGVSPSMSHPANEGKICIRGWHVHEIIEAPDRLRKPLLRRNGALEETTWDEAMGFIASRLRDIRSAHGPDAIAFLTSPRCSNEESYLLQKLARIVLHTNNVDHGAGAYSNYSLDVLLEMLGTPGTTGSLRCLDRSDVIIVSGVDLGMQLPTVGGRVIRRKLSGATLIVIDTRRHRVAESADLFLQHRPGTETVLYGAMAKVIVDRGAMNRPFLKAQCANSEAFFASLVEYDLLSAAEICGVPAEQIEEAALAYARAGAAAILFSTGIEAGDAESVKAMVNLCLLCGQIGREGAGIFSLTEHNNLQGACDMGVLPDRLPGYGAVEDEGVRKAFERLWGASLPAHRGMSARRVLSRTGRGAVRAAWLCRYDPVNTAFVSEAAESLAQCDLVVVQHVFPTETARFAHVVLPTTLFGEERVTFTSTERRIQIADKVIDPPEGIEPGWQQVVRIARALGADWQYDSSAAVMEEIGQAVPFYSGAHYENLSRDYGRQWPCTREHPMGTAVLFASGQPRRTFTFLPAARRPGHGAAGGAYPFTLVFGHSLYYWHRNVLIQRSETLRREYRMLLLDYPDGFVEINQSDAQRLGIRDGDPVRLHSAAGSSTTAARVTAEVMAGTVYAPYFLGRVLQQLGGDGEDRVRFLPVRIEKEAA